jgi:3'-phosphoadenosine 5'-phosphosulfate (PAPS) 3'-phosphatase
MPIHRGTPVVTVIGTPAELILYTAGRRSAAQVRMDGTQTAIDMVSQATWRL